MLLIAFDIRDYFSDHDNSIKLLKRNNNIAAFLSYEKKSLIKNINKNKILFFDIFPIMLIQITAYMLEEEEGY
jgi:hypothetical protein